jgi:hypothetical protein
MTHGAVTPIEKSWFAENLPCLSALPHSIRHRSLARTESHDALVVSASQLEMDCAYLRIAGRCSGRLLVG